MNDQGQNFSFPQKGTVFGRSRGGMELTENTWGNGANSILFCTGFSAAEEPLSRLLFQWRNDLFQQEKSTGILGDFDLKLLKNKCTIRIVECINPDSLKINRNGITKILNKPLETRENERNNLPICTNLRGVDLNRNFNANWLKMRRENPYRSDIGPFPESEPETAFLAARLKKNLPRSAVILRRWDSGIFYSEQATDKERREANFLGEYSSLPVFPASDTDGTLLQWLTDRGTKAFEIRTDAFSVDQYPRFRNLLTMCAALT